MRAPLSSNVIVLVLATAAVVLVGLTIWIVVPAPTYTLLTLGVGAPELSPWLAALSALVGVLAARLCWGSTTGRVAAVCAGVAFLLSAWPLVRIPSTLRRFDEEWIRAFGAEAAAGPLDGSVRPPIVARDLVMGIAVHPVRVTRGIPFGSGGDGRLTLDVYAPSSGSARVPAAVVVQLYGGAWQRGEPGDDPTLATYLASRGYVVVALDYRHAPGARWPAQAEDLRAGLRWVETHVAASGGDPGRIVLLGRSAGAQLALTVAYADRNEAIRGVVSFYGPVDLVEGWRTPPWPDPIGVRAVLEAYLGGPPGDRLERYREASPISLVSPTAPPTLLIHGTRDHIVEARFVRSLHARLRAAGVAAALLELPWAEHAFDAVPNGISAQIALHYTERFLLTTLGGPFRRSAEQHDAPWDHGHAD